MRCREEERAPDKPANSCRSLQVGAAVEEVGLMHLAEEVHLVQEVGLVNLVHLVAADKVGAPGKPVDKPAQHQNLPQRQR